MKSKKEILILVIIIIVLGVIYGVQQSAKRLGADSLPQPAAFTAEDVRRIEITTPEERLNLVLADDGRWMLIPADNPAGYVVNEQFSANLPEALANFKLTAIISENKDDYARYQLDDAAKISVKAFDAGGKPLLDFDLGSTVAGNFRHSYVKMTGDPNVYHGRGNLRVFFDTGAFELREKEIIRYNNDEIAAIGLDTFADGGRTLIVSQPVKDADGNEVKIWLGPQGVYVDSGEVESFLNYVKNTLVYDFLPLDYDLGEPEWALVLFYDDDREPETLRVYAGIPSPDGDDYGQTHPATSTTMGSPFLLTLAQQSDMFKRFGELLVKREADGASTGQLHVENLPEDGAEPVIRNTTEDGITEEDIPEEGKSSYSGGMTPTSNQNVGAQQAATEE